MTNSPLVSPVKMEYGLNLSISGLKMMMKSGLEKIFLKFLHVLTMSFLLMNFDQKYKFHPYSILTGDTRVAFVIYGVLSYKKSISKSGCGNLRESALQHDFPFFFFRIGPKLKLNF